MRSIDDITDETIQRHIIQFEQDEIVFVLRFHPFTEMWTFDLTYKDKSANGVKLAVGVLHIRSENFPFDFVVSDESGTGLDPFRSFDFSEGRNILYILDAADMAGIRGTTVQI
jgi:hypothetical protein